MIKKSIITFIIGVLFIGADAQEVYNPNVAIKPIPSMSVYKVVLTDSSTVVTVRLRNTNQLPPFTIQSQKVFIRKVGDPGSIPMLKSKNMPFAPDKHIFKFKDEILEFVMYFPPLEKPVKYFDILEDSPNKTFYLQGVIVDEELNREITRGFKAYELGDVNQSLQHFINVAEMDLYFEYGLAYFNILYILANQRRWSEAAEWYEKFKNRFFYDKVLYTNELQRMGIIQRIEEEH